MPNLLQRGASFLGSRMKDAAGREVTYTRRGQTVTLTGWPSRQEYEVTDEETGLPLRITSYDWSFVAEELVFETERIVPRPGDQITETQNSQNVTYEAMPPGKMPVSERLDTGDVLIVVHTKQTQCRAS